MCHTDDSRPPTPPIVGEVASSGRTTMTGADGTTFAAFTATPATPNGRSVVVLPDVRGLHPYYEALAVRFAEAGFTAVAVDWFGRTAGTGERGDDFAWEELIAQVRPEEVRSDVAAALAHLEQAGGGPAYTVGFCFGGSQSWRLSASDLPLAGCIGFYGMPRLLADVEADLATPVLLLVAGADAATPQEDFRALDGRLHDAGVPHEMHVYDGAPHSFFDRAYADWQDACADAWQRILSFTGVAQGQL